MRRVPRWLLIVGVVLIAALLAFPLRDTIYQTVVIPIAFMVWELGLFYRSLSQAIWWWVVIAVVLLPTPPFALVTAICPQVSSSSRNCSECGCHDER